MYSATSCSSRQLRSSATMSSCDWVAVRSCSFKNLPAFKRANGDWRWRRDRARRAKEQGHAARRQLLAPQQSAAGGGAEGGGELEGALEGSRRRKCKGFDDALRHGLTTTRVLHPTYRPTKLPLCLWCTRPPCAAEHETAMCRWGRRFAHGLACVYCEGSAKGVTEYGGRYDLEFVQHDPDEELPVHCRELAPTRGMHVPS
jgi:hypothetical protein